MIVKEVTRPALRYHGGKFVLRKWIVSHFPPHDHYCEVFGGGASILLSKEPAQINTYNDLDSSVVNFFRVLRERPDQLIDLINLTPWAREELLLSKSTRYTGSLEPDIEKARRFFVRSWMGRGKATATMNTGWRYEKTTVRGSRAYDDFSNTDHLNILSSVLKDVQIENDHALKVIDRFDTKDTLFYLDPPYVTGTRSDRWGKKAYKHEMSIYDHARLLRRLRDIKGMAIVSGYPHTLYTRMLEKYGWRLSTKEVNTDGKGDKLPRRTECLWISPSCIEKMDPGPLFKSF